jgi:hypothetical protein
MKIEKWMFVELSYTIATPYKIIEGKSTEVYYISVSVLELLTILMHNL